MRLSAWTVCITLGLALTACTKAKLVNKRGAAHEITDVGPPTILSVSPKNGPFAGGTLITLTGTGFVSGAQVTVGDLPCTPVTFVSDTTLTCTTAAHAVGFADVVVINPDSQAARQASAYAFSDMVNPVGGAAIASGGGFSASGDGIGMRAQESIGTLVSPMMQTAPGIRSLAGTQGVWYEP